MIRALHPRVGWNPVTTQLFVAFTASVVFIVLFNITVLVVGSFTLDPTTLALIFRFQLFGSSYTTFLAVAPIPIILLATGIPSSFTVEKFGSGRFRTKAAVLLYASIVLSVGAIIRLVSVASRRTMQDPGNLNSKAVFYTTGFMLEITVVVLYALVRVDLRFYVPDGSTGAGDYSKGKKLEDPEPELDVNNLNAEYPVRKGSSTKLSSELEDVKRLVEKLRFGNDVFAYSIPAGDPNLLLYIFRNGVPGVAPPTRPSRASAWVGNVKRKTQMFIDGNLV
jgi:hypothetical protein